MPIGWMNSHLKTVKIADFAFKAESIDQRSIANSLSVIAFLTFAR